MKASPFLLTSDNYLDTHQLSVKRNPSKNTVWGYFFQACRHLLLEKSDTASDLPIAYELLDVLVCHIQMSLQRLALRQLEEVTVNQCVPGQNSKTLHLEQDFRFGVNAN